MPNIDPSIGDAIVQEAGTWVGTPYRHQQMKKGSGVDCVGLIIGVGHGLGVLEITREAWAPFARYGRLPQPHRFMAAVEQFLVPVDAKVNGCVAVMAWDRNMPMHLGILEMIGDRWFITHAFQHRARCVRHGLTELWESRIESLWCYPGHVIELET